MEAITNFIFQAVQFLIFITVIVSFLVLTTVIGIWLYFKTRFQKELAKESEREGHTVVLSIKVASRNEKREDALEDFLKSIHRLLPHNAHISFEMVSTNQFLRFYIVIPKIYENTIESQIYAQFPDTEVEIVKDYIPDFDEDTATCEINFKHMSVRPIQTYKDLEENILKNISALLSRTEAGEKVYFQLALKRVGSKIHHRGFMVFVLRLMGKKSSYPKLSHDLFIGKLRVAYVAADKASAHQKLTTLTNSFKTVKGDKNELTRKIISYSPTQNMLFKTRLFEQGDIWTPAEIATLYHFPYGENTSANIVHTTSKRAPAPDTLPVEGQVDPKAVSFIGDTNFRNEHKTFGIKRIDRRRHLYVVGKTGSGKSRLLELLLVSDIQNGDGCCLIDPHGDLAEELLKFVPKERVKDVVYINPADNDFPIGFNPLEPVEDYQVRQHLSTFFIAIFKKLFSENWNPRMEHLIRYITLALLATSDSNILGIPRILSDTKYRQHVIMQIQDPVVKSFWTNEFSSYNEQFAAEAVIPIINKVGQFISNPVIRNMVGQRQNMLDFENFMNTGKIVIINLSKGKLGEENAALMGSMFITKIQQAALARAKMAEEKRRDFYFYVDEFQNFATDAFSSILSEARKYHLDLTIAHQYIAQLPDDVKATAFGNVGTIITFAVGGDDAKYLAREFAPTFSPEDMISLNTREMYIKMSIDGKLTPPFSARTINSPKAQFDYSDDIINHSQMTYGKNRVSAENEIKRWREGTQSVVEEQKSDDFPEPII